MRATIRRHADVLFLVLVVLLIGGANLYWSAHDVAVNQAAQQRAGQVLERKLCATLGQLAALKPPAGNPATNPARRYDQQVHATLGQLGMDLGCRKGTR